MAHSMKVNLCIISMHINGGVQYPQKKHEEQLMEGSRLNWFIVLIPRCYELSSASLSIHVR
eukprot:760400-Hanusia_phi.AAC.6